MFASVILAGLIFNAPPLDAQAEAAMALSCSEKKNCETPATPPPLPSKKGPIETPVVQQQACPTAGYYYSFYRYRYHYHQGTFNGRFFHRFGSRGCGR